jgi:small nuclear ribonucleoprotein
MTGRPLDVLEETLQETVTVHLKDGQAYRGLLAGYDQHMNLVLDPEPDDPDLDGGISQVGDTTIIRGDNVVTIRQ